MKKTRKISFFLNEKELSERKKKEIRSFTDLSSYQELMGRPYFRHLKAKVSEVLREHQFKNKKILEIGAGTSEFLSYFEKDNQLTALDINKVLLLQNKTKACLVVADAENLPFDDETFDFIYLVGVLHHLEDQKKALSEIKRVLKPGGRVFISEPTAWSLNLPYYLVRKLMIMILGEGRYMSLSGCGSPDESFISMKAVNEVFRDEFRLKKCKILPLRMPPVYFLEKLYSKKMNEILEKIPLIKDLGTIIFIQGEKC